MNFLTLTVLLSLLACLLFTAITIVLSCLGIMLPDTLIQYFFIVFGVELGATATIKIAKYALDSKAVSDKISRLKENGLPVEKSDLKTNSGNLDNLYDDTINDYGGYGNG